MNYCCRVKSDFANLQEMFVLIVFEKRVEEEVCTGSLLFGVLFVWALAASPLGLYSLWSCSLGRKWKIIIFSL